MRNVSIILQQCCSFVMLPAADVESLDVIADDPTIPPREVIENFKRAYLSVNRCEAQVFYRGNHWYVVNGEAVHRVMVLREIWRLRGMAQRETLRRTDKSILSRLINRIRGM